MSAFGTWVLITAFQMQFQLMVSKHWLGEEGNEDMGYLYKYKEHI